MQDRPPPPASLRERLRGDLQNVHQALDEKISTFDLTELAGYRAFLATHRVALDGIDVDGGAAPDMLGEMVQALGEDMEALGDPALPPLAPLKVQPLALDYMLIGSRLGTQVLRKRWLAATDPHVKAAGAYFSLPSQGAAWRALTEALGDVSGADRQAARIVEDARVLFERFSTSYDLCQTSLFPVMELNSDGPHARA